MPVFPVSEDDSPAPKWIDLRSSGLLTLRVGDREPPIGFRFPPGTDPLAAETVRFVTSNGINALLEEFPGDTEAIYRWADGDTTTAGLFTGEVEVRYAGDRVQTLPAVGHITIRVVEDVG